MTKLTEEQKAFLSTFGYLKLPGLFADRVERISEAFEEVFAAHGGGHHGKPHDGKARSCIIQFLDRHEYLCTLLDDPLIDDLATFFCGADYNYAGSDGNYYVGDTPWHPDCTDGTFPRIKVALYLDPVDRHTGALRVIPGTHKRGDAYADATQREAYTCAQAWGVAGADVPAVALDSAPGDAVCFNQNLLHSSWGGSARRRMFTINFAPHFGPDRQKALHDEIAANARFWAERFYNPTLLRVASPRVRHHLEEISSSDGFLAELSARKKLEMAEPSRG